MTARSQSAATSLAKPSWQDCLDAGMNAKEAAELRGQSWTTARTWAHRNGKRWRRYSADTIEALRHHRDAGYTKAGAARSLGLSKPFVTMFCQRHGIDGWEDGRRRGRLT